MYTQRNSLLIILIFLFTSSLPSQTFRFGAVSGLKFSTQNAAKSVEYSGFNLGGKVGFDVHKKFRTSMDLQFSRKTNSVNEDIQLDYIEVPIMISFMDWMDDPNEEEYYKLHFTAGLSYGHLFNYKVLNNMDEDVTQRYDFNKNTINAIGGLVYFFNEHFGLILQYHHSFSNIRKQNEAVMKNRNWSFNLIYMVNNKRRKF